MKQTSFSELDVVLHSPDLEFQCLVEKTIVHATLDPMDLNKDVEAQYALIGDAKLTLDRTS